MIRYNDVQDIVQAVEKERVLTATATRAILALARCSRWKRPACWLYGHADPVLIPVGGPSWNWWNICPRCGKKHTHRGQTFLPLSWYSA